MFAVLSVKTMRLLLSLSVSIWMAGGCLFGCGTVAAADLEADDSSQTVVAGESCHVAAPSSHDCCAPKKPSKKRIVSNTRQPEGLPAFMPAPRGMMKDCPLVVNATAATSKSSGYVADPGREPVAVLPLIQTKTEQLNISHVKSVLPNRGPTHLRCCVFLI
ncbi:MAG TPA: hypothetical protein VFY60_01905 [Pyrinomonadaceae bacterium]|nr:hypothetical protein [Pyrinomonadaceae bacterium]